MPGAFLFDLDMTLVDSSALAQVRRFQMWDNVRKNMNLIRAFPAQGSAAPHELPGLLKRTDKPLGSPPRRPSGTRPPSSRRSASLATCWSAMATRKTIEPDPEPIQEALQRLGIAATPESLDIGDDVGDIEAAYHAGVTSVAVRWGPASIFELSSSAPDIFMSKASTLLRRERLGGRGYIGEALPAAGPFTATGARSCIVTTTLPSTAWVATSRPQIHAMRTALSAQPCCR